MSIRISAQWSLLWVPALFTLATLALAWMYLFSVEAHRYATPDDTAFIRPLCYVLTALAPLVLATCFERTGKNSTPKAPLAPGSLLVILAVGLLPVAILTIGFVPSALIGGGAQVTAVDPEGQREGEALLPGVQWEDDVYAACEGADLVVILTEWNAFRALDLAKVAASMRTPRLADLRNLYSAEAAREAGFDAYASVGRGAFSGGAA